MRRPETASASCPVSSAVSSAENWICALFVGFVLVLYAAITYFAGPPAEVSSLQPTCAAWSMITASPRSRSRWLTSSGWLTVLVGVPLTVACTGRLPDEMHGTVTVSAVAVAAVTVTGAPPMVTVLSARVVLNWLPFRVADDPGTIGDGLIELMVGPDGSTVEIVKVWSFDVSSPPLAVPPLSFRRTVTVAEPTWSGSVVNVRVPLGETAGCTSKRALLSLLASKVSVCAPSPGPGETDVAQAGNE